MRTAKITDAITKPIKKGAALLALLLTKPVKNASDDALEGAVGACEVIALIFGAFVFFGVGAEVWFAFAHLPPCDPYGYWGPVWSDAMVAIGVGGELLFSFRGSICQGELTRRATDRLADAERALARRTITPAQADTAFRHFQQKAESIDLLIEHQYGDGEAFMYAMQIATLFDAIGVKKIRPIGPNMMVQSAFGLRVSAADSADAEHLREVFTNESGASSAIIVPFDSNHLPGGEGAPNLIIFVAPKPPAPMTFTVLGPKANTNAIVSGR